MDQNVTRISNDFSTSPQLQPEQLAGLAARGFKSVINNRPDGEGGSEQPTSAAIERAAASAGLEYAYLPVVSGKITTGEVETFSRLLKQLPKPILAFCRSGTRAGILYKMANEPTVAASAQPAPGQTSSTGAAVDVLVIGGGAAGLGVIASLLKRQSDLRITLVEPNEKHYYQPAWTLVGAGEFDQKKTVRPMADCIPRGAKWVRASASAFEPEQNRVVLDNGQRLEYHTLIVCPGLKLDWEGVEGLSDALGRNGVTSNYRYDLAPYTWALVQRLKSGKALFTQPAMPIKCAGAPQKAMYLSCDHWRRNGVLDSIDVEFDNAGASLFGVPAYVPPLMKYVERYRIRLAFNSNLKAVDGAARQAWFDEKGADGTIRRVAKPFDFLHVVPPQCAPDFVRASPLADKAGWVEVDQSTLRHPRFENVFSVGDVCSAPNAKTVAAARKQVVVVAENLLAQRAGKSMPLKYDGYGSCPLTVERGKIVLAEFGYGGKLLPTFPLDSTIPRRSAWLLKTRVLPFVYWDGLLKGREWLARPSA